jgi:hypothetical protein
VSAALPPVTIDICCATLPPVAAIVAETGAVPEEFPPTVAVVVPDGAVPPDPPTALSFCSPEEQATRNTTPNAKKLLVLAIEK